MEFLESIFTNRFLSRICGFIPKLTVETSCSANYLMLKEARIKKVQFSGSNKTEEIRYKNGIIDGKNPGI